MRVDEIVSRPTTTTARAIVALAATVIFVKVFDVRLDNLDALGSIKLTGSTLDWAVLGVLLYLGYAHLTNWAVDRMNTVELVNMDNYFGDHPDSWDGPNPPLKGRLTNIWITLRGGFGFSVWTARVSLVYGLHLLLPAVLWLAAVVALIVA
jgi:hypothetical protein